MNEYARVTSKTLNVSMTQLASDVLAIMAQGEKSVSDPLKNCQAEIIRCVLFELKDFAAYQLYQEIRNGQRVYD